MESGCGWTVDTLHQWTIDSLADRDLRYEQRFRSSQEAHHEALEAARRAVEKAEAASERRFESVNEFREQQNDLIGTFARREEVALQLKGVSDQVAAHTTIDSENYKELSGRIEKLGDRVTSAEGITAGVATQRTESRLNMSQVTASVVALLYLISVIVAFLVGVHR